MARLNHLYPHLLPAEISIWEAWLALNPTRFTHFEYDVHVGQEPRPVPNQPSSEARLRRALLRRRIDIVATDADGLTIIEIKPTLDLKAIGQAIAYPILFAIDHPGAPEPRVLLVAAQIENNTAVVLEKLHIPFELLDMTK